MVDKLLENLTSSSPLFRAAPFWAWNSKLEPEELRRQIRIFKEMGLGGFFMHSRVGMNTPYLSEHWFQCVDACVDEAKKNGLDAWLYDEDRWPSGAAGGLVTRDPKYRQRNLKQKFAATAADLGEFPAENLLGAYLVTWAKRGDTIAALEKVEQLPEQAPPGKELLVIYWEIQECSSWFNGCTYLDTMNPEAVGKFIAVTHAEYLKRCGNEFGKTIPGIFTDEPNYNHLVLNEGLPWTAAIPATFLKDYGYDLMDNLPEVFFSVGTRGFSKVRHDFFETCTKLFVNSFGKLIGEWCAANNLQLTGHLFFEDRLWEQRRNCGTPMRFYEYMQTPGIDLLTEKWDIPETAKQCSSVAHQLGMKRRMCESYGCTGWDFPFAGHKALGDWLAVLGINFRVQHLAWYTMEAEAKRDYPASISFQSSWYRQYKYVEDYFARVNAALWEGEEVRDILVIHPIESYWGSTLTPETSELMETDTRFHAVTTSLLAAHLDFDYGDEELMSRYASVEAREDGPRLVVGKASYRAVVLPQLDTIRTSTLEVLRKFIECGGKVVALGALPAYLDCQSSGLPAAVLGQCQLAGKPMELCGLLEDVRRVSVKCCRDGKEAGPVYSLVKRAGEYETLFLVNTSTEHCTDVLQAPEKDDFFHQLLYRGQYLDSRIGTDRNLEFPEAQVAFKCSIPGASVYELDLSSGKFTGVPHTEKDGFLCMDAPLVPLASRLYVFTAKEIPVAAASGGDQCALQKLPAPTAWDYTLGDHNVFVLDQAQCTVDGKELDKQVHYILPLDDLLRTEYLKCPARGGAMVQPWLNPANPVPDRVLDLELKYNFLCDAIPTLPVWLAIERPDLYEICLNDTQVELDDAGHWVDPSIRKILLPAEAFRSGVNFLVLKCKYHRYLPGLEACYLLGDFGVKNKRTLTVRPEKMTVGDWCEQTLPFYSGSVTYVAEVEIPAGISTVKIELGKWAGAAVGIRFNDGEQQILGWPPYTASFTGGVKPGKNRVEITIFGSRRNAFGPFYDLEARPGWVGSEQLKAFLTNEKQLVPCGLLEGVSIYVGMA